MIGHLKMRSKVIILLLLSLMAFCVLAVISLVTLSDSLREERQAQIKAVSQSVLSLAQDVQKNIDAGAEKQDEAIADFYQTMMAWRYDNGIGYFFGTDDEGLIQFHADIPSLQGKNLIGLEDHNGAMIIQETIAAAKGKNEGFYSYHWTKPNVDKELKFEKVSYAVRLPWGHNVATGIYVDDLAETYSKFAWRIGVIGILTLLILLPIALLISRDLSRSLSGLSEVMKGIMQGRYDDEIVTLNRRDEVGSISRSVADFRERIQENEGLREENARAEQRNQEQRRAETLKLADDLEAQIKSLSEDIALNVTQLKDAAEKMTTVADGTSKRSNEVAGATEEMSAPLLTKLACK